MAQLLGQSAGAVVTSVFEHLRAGVFRQPSHAYTPTTQTFPDLAVERVSRELKLTAKGVEDGRADLPPADSEVFGRAENEILETISAAQKNNYDQLENHLAGYRQRLIDLDFEGRFADIAAAASAGFSNLAAQFQIGLGVLHPIRRQLWDAEQWRDAFRKKHRLMRPAKVNTAAASTIKVLVLIILVMVELAINGSFLSRHSDYGLVGGIIEALSFAAFNVISAFCIGLYGVRGLVHRNWGFKLWGLIWLAAYLALAIGLNLGLAHYREYAGTSLESAGQYVMERLAQRPFTLDEFNSWVLFGLGIAFSLLALVDGLIFTDSYFGYAAVERYLRKVQKEYQDRREELIQELQEVRQDYDDVLTDARTDLGKRRTEHNAIVDNRIRLLRLCQQAESQLETAANMLFSTYRDPNRANRKSPVPARFGQQFKLQRIEPLVSAEGEWKAERLEAAINQAHADLTKLHQQLGIQFDAALEAYRGLDILVPDAK